MMMMAFVWLRAQTMETKPVTGGKAKMSDKDNHPSNFADGLEMTIRITNS